MACRILRAPYQTPERRDSTTNHRQSVSGSRSGTRSTTADHPVTPIAPRTKIGSSIFSSPCPLSPPAAFFRLPHHSHAHWNTLPGRGWCGPFPALSREVIKTKNHNRYFGGVPWRTTRRGILSCGVHVNGAGILQPFMYSGRLLWNKLLSCILM